MAAYSLHLQSLAGRDFVSTRSVKDLLWVMVVDVFVFLKRPRHVAEKSLSLL